MNQSKNQYDVIIIGAGIGGLVCGCYLAKAGLKTLILERNSYPGGCCTYFVKDDFEFDACVHTLGGLRKDGTLRKVFSDIGIVNDLKINRITPSDTIVTPNGRVNFWGDYRKNLSEFRKHFPRERKLESFFNFIANERLFSIFNKLRNLTFQDVLDFYFTDQRLKSIFSLPLLGNAGLPSSLISASTGVIVYREFMFDGGYYPEGGIKVIPQVLEKKFKKFGGKILYSTEVTGVVAKKDSIKSVFTVNSCSFSSKRVVVNSDMTNFFSSLFQIKNKIGNPTAKLNPSLSAFSIYLGSKNKQREVISKSNLWILPHYNIENMFKQIKLGSIEKEDIYTLCFSSPSHSTKLSNIPQRICLFVNAPFKNKDFWSKNKYRKADLIVQKTKKFLPFLSDFELKTVADPIALFNYTLNYKGATYGWASTPMQEREIYKLNIKHLVKGLYFVSHWLGQGHGLPGVSYAGKNIASLVLKDYQDG